MLSLWLLSSSSSTYRIYLINCKNRSTTLSSWKDNLKIWLRIWSHSICHTSVTIIAKLKICKLSLTSTKKNWNKNSFNWLNVRISTNSHWTNLKCRLHSAISLKQSNIMCSLNHWCHSWIGSSMRCESYRRLSIGRRRMFRRKRLNSRNLRRT